jgi:transcriptional regulator with XRE-family HTH domain
MSQRQLAEAAGLGAGAVNDILHHPERQPRLATLRALGVALGLGTDALVEAATGRIAPETTEPPYGRMAPEEVAELPPLGAWGDFVQLLEDKPEQWAFFRVPRPPHMPSVGGSAGYDFVLVEQEAVVQSGALALAETAGIYVVGYYVEPYIVCQTAAGAITHYLVDRHRTRLLGRVIFRTSFL